MSYSGTTLTLPLGEEGLVGSHNQALIGPGALLIANNLTYENGTLQKEGGAELYSTIQSDTLILGGWDWWPTPIIQRQVIYSQAGATAAIKMDNGAGAFTITAASGLPIVRPLFVEGGAESGGRDKKLFIFGSMLDARVITGTGTTTTVIGGTPLTPPGGSMTATLLPAGGGGGGGGNIDNGVHHYAVTFLTAGGETIAGSHSNPLNVVDKTTFGIAQVDNIPFGPANVTSKNLYRTKAGGTTYFLLANIGNTTLTYIDNIADAALPATPPPPVNTTNGRPVEWAGTNWPTCGAVHERRLWAGGLPSDPHRLFFSIEGDHENFMSIGSGSLSVYPGEGERIVGMLSYNGLLVVWKYPKGIYLIDARSPVLGEWGVTRKGIAWGGVSALGHAVVDEDVVFIDPTGEIQLLSAVQEFGNLGGQSLSQATQLNPLIRDTFDLSKLEQTTMVYYGAKRQLHIGMTAHGDACNTRRLVACYARPTQPRFRLSDRDRPVSLWRRRDSQRMERLMLGDDTGHVWTLDTDTRAKNGVGYEGRFQTNHTDFSYADPSLASKRKNGQFLELIVEPKGPHNLTVHWYWDGLLAGTKLFTMGELGHPSLIHVRHRITGSGYRFALEGINNGLGEDFSIAQAVLSFTVSDERVSAPNGNNAYLLTSYVLLQDAAGGLWYGYVDDTGELTLSPATDWPPGGIRLNGEVWSWLARVSPNATVWYLSPDTSPAGGWIVSTTAPAGVGSSDEGLTWTAPDRRAWVIDVDDSGAITLTTP